MTDPIYPHLADQGQGLDLTPLTIAAAPLNHRERIPATTPTPTTTARPPNPRRWPAVERRGDREGRLLGLQLPGQLDVPEPGSGRLRPDRGRFPSDRHRRFARQRRLPRRSDAPRLTQGTSQVVNQTVHLPSVLPNGQSIPSDALGRIAVLVDPDHDVDETLRSNSLAESAPVPSESSEPMGRAQSPRLPRSGPTWDNHSPPGPSNQRRPRRRSRPL